MKIFNRHNFEVNVIGISTCSLHRTPKCDIYSSHMTMFVVIYGIIDYMIVVKLNLWLLPLVIFFVVIIYAICHVIFMTMY
jgi:hypothetical protein